MRYVIGLDIGIGSIGWAAVCCDERRKILDFGVRIFESGELSGGKDRTSQERRRFRSQRRLIRRRSHRKARIKAHLENIGLVRALEIEEYMRGGKNNVIDIRVRGLDEKLSPVEIAACLINFCNRRGYQDFYEADTKEMTAEEKKEYEEEKSGAAIIDNLMTKGGYRSVAEMILRDDYFNSVGEFRSYRNTSTRAEQLRINRAYLIDECKMILKKQQEFYPEALTDTNIRTASDLIFRQRMFEEGPGFADRDSKYRRYAGFLDTFGNCRFFPDEKRGCRFTVLADIYALVNSLSQYRYYDSEKQPAFTSGLARDLIHHALAEGKIAKKDVKAIAKKHGLEVNMSDTDKKDNLSTALRYIKVMKPLFDEFGLNWQEAITQNTYDMKSLLNRLGTCLSLNITPRRRKKKLQEFGELPEGLLNKLVSHKFSGTCSVSDKYMLGAVESFLEGEPYGKHQAEFIRQQEQAASDHPKFIKLPPFDKDFEFFKNPVVCRAINETRKIVNAIIGQYGSPYAINIEVASDLNRSFEERGEIEKEQNKNRKETERIKKRIAELLNKNESEVSAVQIERYALGEQQGWKCLYSGREITAADCLDPNTRVFEVDHIIPYSLILDNTRQNKALVYADENQRKGQRTPLMYLTGEREKDFIGRVTELYKGKKISRKKYDYLMQRTLDEGLLDERKSRNLNDTRYISKFLVRYFRENLVFNHSEDETYRRTEVYAVKAAITSQLRRLWLNEKTWGRKNKDELKQVTYLDHAADAVVIACCMPAYVEIAIVQNKLSGIYNKKKQETEEYKAIREHCLETMFTYYGMKSSEVLPLLRRSDRTPCLINHLREEVDIRFIEPVTHRFFCPEEAEMTDDEIAALFHEKCAEFYADDPAFAASLQPVITSHKQEKSASGGITLDQPVSLVYMDGVPRQLKKKALTELTKEQIPLIRTGDSRLIETLTELMKDMEGKDTVGKALERRGEQQFVMPGGQVIHRVTLMDKDKYGGKLLNKVIDNSNHTVMNAQNYYCIELYQDTSGKLNMRGITYADLVKSGGKLYLSERCVMPDDYVEHIMYLYKWDYIEVTAKDGNRKFHGYAVGSFNVNQRLLCYAFDNTQRLPKKALTISKEDKVKKYSIDLLGKKGGEISCGEPLLSIREKK